MAGAVNPFGLFHPKGDGRSLPQETQRHGVLASGVMASVPGQLVSAVNSDISGKPTESSFFVDMSFSSKRSSYSDFSFPPEELAMLETFLGGNDGGRSSSAALRQAAGPGSGVANLTSSTAFPFPSYGAHQVASSQAQGQPGPSFSSPSSIAGLQLNDPLGLSAAELYPIGCMLAGMPAVGQQAATASSRFSLPSNRLPMEPVVGPRGPVSPPGLWPPNVSTSPPQQQHQHQHHQQHQYQHHQQHQYQHNQQHQQQQQNQQQQSAARYMPAAGAGVAAVATSLPMPWPWRPQSLSAQVQMAPSPPQPVQQPRKQPTLELPFLSFSAEASLPQGLASSLQPPAAESPADLVIDEKLFAEIEAAPWPDLTASPLTVAPPLVPELQLCQQRQQQQQQTPPHQLIAVAAAATPPAQVGRVSTVTPTQQPAGRLLPLPPLPPLPLLPPLPPLLPPLDVPRGPMVPGGLDPRVLVFASASQVAAPAGADSSEMMLRRRFEHASSADQVRTPEVQQQPPHPQVACGPVAALPPQIHITSGPFGPAAASAAAGGEAISLAAAPPAATLAAAAAANAAEAAAAKAVAVPVPRLLPEGFLPPRSSSSILAVQPPPPPPPLPPPAPVAASCFPSLATIAAAHGSGACSGSYGVVDSAPGPASAVASASFAGGGAVAAVGGGEDVGDEFDEAETGLASGCGGGAAATAAASAATMPGAADTRSAAAQARPAVVAGSGGGGAAAAAAAGKAPRTALTLDTLRTLFELPSQEVVRALGISATDLKRRCRALGIRRWPHRKLVSLQRLAQAVEADTELAPHERQVVLQSVSANRSQILQDPNAELAPNLKVLRQVQYKRLFLEKRGYGSGHC